MRNRRKLRLLVLLAGIGLAFALARPDPGKKAHLEQQPRFGRDESVPIDSTHVGKTREELIAELGEPARQGPWHIGLPDAEYRAKYPLVQTMEWEWRSGSFFASVHPVEGVWVCFCSYWVPKGWVID